MRNNGLESLGDIQVAATPVNAKEYSVYADRSGGLAGKLANALSGLQPSLVNYIKKDVRDTEEEFKNAFYGQSMAEADAYRKAGHEEYSGPYLAALNRQYGIKAATEAHLNITKSIQSGDINILDSSQLDEAIQSARENLGAEVDQHIVNGFESVFGKLSNQLRLDQSRAQGEAAKTARYDIASETMYNLTSDYDFKSSAEDAQSFGELLDGLKENYGPNTLLNIPRSDFSRMHMNLAEKLAHEGKYELVKEILTRPQGEQPSLMDGSQYSNKASLLLKRAEAEQLNLKREAWQGSLMDWMVKADNGDVTKSDIKAIASEMIALGYSASQSFSVTSRLEGMSQEHAEDSFNEFAFLMKLDVDKIDLSEADIENIYSEAKEAGVRPRVIASTLLSVLDRNRSALDAKERETAKLREDQLKADLKAQAETNLETLAEANQLYLVDKNLAKAMGVSVEEAKQQAMLKVISKSSEPVLTIIRKGWVVDKVQGQVQSVTDTFHSMANEGFDFNDTNNPVVEGWSIYKVLRQANPSLAKEYAGDDYERLEAFHDKVQYYGFNSRAATAILQVEERLQNIKLDYSGLSREVARRSPTGPQQLFAQGNIEKMARRYMEQAGYSAASAARKAKEDFEKLYVQVNNSWVKTMSLPNIIDPISKSQRQMTITDVEKVREVFIKQYKEDFEAEYDLDVDEDDIDLVVVPTGIMFTHNGTMPFFESSVFENGLLRTKDIPEALNLHIQDVLNEIADDAQFEANGPTQDLSEFSAH